MKREEIMEQEQKKILVVDDEAPIADLIAEFCEIIGYKTRVIYNGKEVVNAVKQFCPDLITLDLNMPDVPGATILTVLKKDSDTRSIPVLIISSNVDSTNPSQQMDESLKLSQAILPKPIEIKTLRMQIDKALAKKGK